MRTNTAATLYSRSIANGAEIWTRQAIPAVYWEERKGATLIQPGMMNADQATVIIPGLDCTVKVGDVLVKGAITKTIGQSYTMTNLRAEYTTVKVSSVAVMDYGSASMQHLEVGGS